jgi:hypothetical protein
MYIVFYIFIYFSKHNNYYPNFVTSSDCTLGPSNSRISFVCAVLSPWWQLYLPQSHFCRRLITSTACVCLSRIWWKSSPFPADRHYTYYKIYVNTVVHLWTLYLMKIRYYLAVRSQTINCVGNAERL